MEEPPAKHDRSLAVTVGFLVSVAVLFNLLMSAIGSGGNTSNAAPDIVMVDSRHHELRGGDQADCAARCLFVLSRIAGKKVSLPELREACETSAQGANMLAVKNAALKFGFNTEGVRINRSALRAHVSVSRHGALLHSGHDHYFVVAGYNDDSFVVVDPSNGVFKVKNNDSGMEQLAWTGNTLLLSW